MAYESISSHRAMAMDAMRNEAYHAALARVITPESVVLDLGAGTGILGLVAARLGARRVYLVEPSNVITVAEEIVAANGLTDVVTCLHGRLEDLAVPEKVDVIVSVMTGNFLLTEDLLPILFRARDTLLKPGGHLVPDAAVMEAALVSAPQVHHTHVASWSTPQFGVDLSPARQLAANTMFYGPERLSDAQFLSEPADLLSMDFATASYDPLHAKVTFTATESGTCHGVVGWFRMRLGDAWLSTSPKAPQLHWSSAFMPVDPPLVVGSGEAVSFALDRVPRGDWSWRVRVGAQARRHSTMLAAPVDPKSLDKASRNHVPARTRDLDATAFVLSAVDNVADVTSIAERLRSQFPERFPTVDDALEFTQLTVARF